MFDCAARSAMRTTSRIAGLSAIRSPNDRRPSCVFFKRWISPDSALIFSAFCIET